MWPKYLDLSRDSCARALRQIELEAYSGVVRAFRAQGDLTKERRKVLQDLSSMLKINVERHKLEVRCAFNDEYLATIFSFSCPHGTDKDWGREGRRIIPLLRRATPVTAFTELANKNRTDIENYNRSLKPPHQTRTTARPPVQPKDSKYPSKDLSEIIVKDEEGNVRVQPPTLSLPPLPRKYKDLQEYFGGDSKVVILPSGTAVRVKNTVSSDVSYEEDKKQNGRRKRKQSSNASDQAPPLKTASVSYDVLEPGWEERVAIFQKHKEDYHRYQALAMPPPKENARTKKDKEKNGLSGVRKTPLINRPRKPRSSKIMPKPQTESGIETIVHQPLAQPRVDEEEMNPLRILMASALSSGPIQHDASGRQSTQTTHSVIMEQEQQHSTMMHPQTQEIVSIPQPPPIVTSIVVTSTLSPSPSIVSTVTKQTAAPISFHQTIRQGLVTVSMPSSSATVVGNGPLRLQNVPQIISAAFVNGSPYSSTPKYSSTLASLSTTMTTHSAPISISSAKPIAPAHVTQTVKLRTDDVQTTPGTVKVLPVGTRILPKFGGPLGNQPVYMVSSGQNVMRLARPAHEDGMLNNSNVKILPAARISTGAVGGVSSPHRVVTVNASQLRPNATIRAQGSSPAPAIAKMLQPRIIQAPVGLPSFNRAALNDKPSVIVLQKAPGGKAILKDSTVGHRLMQPKSGISKPIVIMSKPAHALPHTVTSETSSSPQGNVIVLDLSQDGKMASQPNNTLSEIFNSTVLNDEPSEPVENFDSITNQRSSQQVLLQQRTPPERESL